MASSGAINMALVQPLLLSLIQVFMDLCSATTALDKSISLPQGLLQKATQRVAHGTAYDAKSLLSNEH